ncbi:hypothetical protein BGZ54_002368 [Gamsiella multidivaricata]|nr:hypothetical protein BGZ54_002368 [Gamsiella multidivaricata]
MSSGRQSAQSVRSRAASSQGMVVDLEDEDDEDDGEIKQDGARSGRAGSQDGGGSGGSAGVNKKHHQQQESSEVHKCMDCGKVYKHPNCLWKHRWLHSVYWKVQLMEAAAILLGMDESREGDKDPVVSMVSKQRGALVNSVGSSSSSSSSSPPISAKSLSSSPPPQSERVSAMTEAQNNDIQMLTALRNGHYHSAAAAATAIAVGRPGLESGRRPSVAVKVKVEPSSSSSDVSHIRSNGVKAQKTISQSSSTSSSPSTLSSSTSKKSTKTSTSLSNPSTPPTLAPDDGESLPDGEEDTRATVTPPSRYLGGPLSVEDNKGAGGAVVELGLGMVEVDQKPLQHERPHLDREQEPYRPDESVE